MLSQYLSIAKALGVVLILGAIAYFSYDYGVTTTERAAQVEQDRLIAKLDQKKAEAYKLATELANQKPIVEIEYRTIEKEVIKYAQANSDKQCVASDDDWLHIRADAVRAHNRAISVQQSAAVPDDPTKAPASAGYSTDAEVLAEDVANLQTCAENAKQLESLQIWIKAQLPE